MPLTDIVCKAAKPKDKIYKLSDEKGLYLEVRPNGGRYWKQKYRIDGKEKKLSFGVYPEVSLKEAREKRDEARSLIANGADPSAIKKQQKQEKKKETENAFEKVAAEWHENNKGSWSKTHGAAIWKRVETNLLPYIGKRAIDEITPPELLDVIRKIESRGALEVAHRSLQSAGQIFRYAIATGKAERDITADLKGALKTRKVEHYARLSDKELPEFFSKLVAYDGDIQTVYALKFLILTMTRTTETRGARWEEIDWVKKEWRIPGERMKMRSPHIVPLSNQAMALLEEIKLINHNREHLFPNRNKPRIPISENTMLYAMYRMGYHSRATPHGFRATASTILNENGFKPDVIERQLAHAERNKVRAAYNHAEYLAERRDMMQWWGDYLAKEGL